MARPGFGDNLARGLISVRLDEKLTAHSGAYFDGEPVDSLQTPFQLIEVFDTPSLGKLMRIDGANMTSERDEFFYHEALIHPSAIAHPSPQQVLIVGGGDGGSAEEVLKHRHVARLVIAELDAGVIEMSRKHLQSVHRGAFDDARTEIQIGDGMRAVRDSDAQWDLIYLDLTDPIGPAEALYQAGFYRDCRRALKPGGALVLHIGSPFSHAGRVKDTIASLESVFGIVAPYFVHVPAYGANWGFAIASDSLDPRTIDAATVGSRLAERRIDHRQLYNGAMHHAMLAVPEFIREMLASNPQKAAPIP